MSDRDDDLKAFGLDKASSHLRHTAKQHEVDTSDLDPSLLLGPTRSKAFRAALAAKLASRRPIPPMPSQKRRHTVGFGPIVVAPRTSLAFRNQPQCLFRANQIRNLGDVDDLELIEMFVGRKSQLAGSYPHMAISFRTAFTVPGVFKPFDTCDPALFITFQVKNMGLTPRIVTLEIDGDAVF